MKIRHHIEVNKFNSCIFLVSESEIHLLSLVAAFALNLKSREDKKTKILFSSNLETNNLNIKINSIFDNHNYQTFFGQLSHKKVIKLDDFLLSMLCFNKNIEFDYYIFVEKIYTKQWKLFIWNKEAKPLDVKILEQIVKNHLENSDIKFKTISKLNIYNLDIVNILKTSYLFKAGDRKNSKLIVFNDNYSNSYIPYFLKNIGYDIKFKYDQKKYWKTSLEFFFSKRNINAAIDVKNQFLLVKIGRKFQIINNLDALLLIIYYWLFVVNLNKNIVIVSPINLNYLSQLNSRILYSPKFPIIFDFEKFVFLFVTADLKINFFPHSNVESNNFDLFGIIFLEVLNYYNSQQKSYLEMVKIISRLTHFLDNELIMFNSNKPIKEIIYYLTKMKEIKEVVNNQDFYNNKEILATFEYHNSENQLFLLYNKELDKYYIRYFFGNATLKETKKIVKKIKKVIK
ncbi:hypothetical protein [Mesomycoplasma conjunctivae]|uniref:hypothetical protein n=1 Tax=Mesomycoplasma conjunctivae TaxID=45361 RepID=UPI003DA641F3